MKTFIKVPQVPFTVRMFDTSNLDHYEVSESKLYTVTEVLQTSNNSIGYKLLEIDNSDQVLFDAKRFAIYTISAPN